MGQTLSCTSSWEKLYQAVREGDVRVVDGITAKDPKLANYSRYGERMTPLHVAAAFGQLEVVLLLLERRARLDACNSLGQTPLMLACKSGRWVCVPPLVERGANILCFDLINRRTSLHYAAKGGHVECVRQLLIAAQTGPVAESWGLGRFVNVRDSSGCTPLHLAARAGHTATVRILLEYGALVSSSTSVTQGQGSLPLHCAARGGSVECVRELLAWGADRHHRDFHGYTPYFIALKSGHTACAALLDPSSAEPLVWPSPWKFMNRLDSDVKELLEASLAEAHAARFARRGFLKGAASRITIMLPSDETAKGPGVDVDLKRPDDLDERKPGEGESDLCSICFERICTIQVRDCGHQMCAMCTLALCCHCKPNTPTLSRSPPMCPFCRREIMRLVSVNLTTNTSLKEEQKPSGADKPLPLPLPLDHTMTKTLANTTNEVPEVAKEFKMPIELKTPTDFSNGRDAQGEWLCRWS